MALIKIIDPAQATGKSKELLTTLHNSIKSVPNLAKALANSPAALKAWYSKNLGIRMGTDGSVFEWRQGMDSTKKGFTIWAPFKETTKYFQPSEKQFMINYRVEGLDQLLAQMKAAGILPTDSVEKVSYGKFVHLMDPEGNKIELWEPNDVEFAKMGTITTK